MDGFTYAPQFYQMQTSIETCSTFLMYAFLLTFILGIFGSKSVATEMIVHAQIIYYSLITVFKPNPSFLALTNMKFIGGVYVHPNNLTQSTIPDIFKNLGFSSNFLGNFNIMLASFLLCPAVAGIFYLSAKFTKTIRMNKKLKDYARQCLTQVYLYVSSFNILKVVISIMINFQWSEGQIGEIVFGIIIVCMILGSIILLVILRNSYKQYNDEYHVDKSCRIYIYVLLAKVFLEAILLGVQNRLLVSIYVILAIEVGMIIYVGISRPHLKLQSYIRQLVNIALTIVCLAVIAYYGQSSKNYLQPVVQTLYLPIVIISLLFVMLVLNLGLILKYIIVEYIIYWIQKREQQKYAEKAEQPIALEVPISFNPLQSVEAQMIQTLKQNMVEYNSRQGLNLSNMLQKNQNQKKELDEEEQMRKKLKFLNANFG